MPRLRFTLLLICSFIAITAFAQRTDTVYLKKKSFEGKIVTDRPPQAVYFGIGGAGLVFSANYDRRFSKRLDGAGFSVGGGVWFGDGVSVFTLPVSLNYLIGKKNNFFELAAGATLATADVDWSDNSGAQGTIFGHVNLGYRYQPATGGFFFRGGFSPLFANGGSVMWYYLGFGYSF